jgi:hypothetical protein
MTPPWKPQEPKNILILTKYARILQINIYWRKSCHVIKQGTLSVWNRLLFYQGGYLNFSALFLKSTNIISTIKLWYKEHFVKNKTYYAACLKNEVNSLLPKHIKWISSSVLLLEFGDVFKRLIFWSPLEIRNSCSHTCTAIYVFLLCLYLRIWER